MSTTDLRNTLRRLENILAVAQGNTRALETSVAELKAELARREGSTP